MPLFLSIKSYPNLNTIFRLIIFYNTDTVISYEPNMTYSN